MDDLVFSRRKMECIDPFSRLYHENKNDLSSTLCKWHNKAYFFLHFFLIKFSIKFADSDHISGFLINEKWW